MSNWQWYWGYNDENCLGGPFETKQDAIGDGLPDSKDFCGIHIVEAKKGTLKLADEFNVSNWLYDVEDSLCSADRGGNPEGEGLFANLTPEQTNDLQSRVKQSIHDWQHAHDLVFDPWFFTDQRNEEFIKYEK